MISNRPSVQRRRTLGRTFAAVLTAALALSSVGPAESVRAAAPAAGSGASRYTVIVTPPDVTLCPGESEQVAVRVSRQVTRSRGGRQTTGRPRDVRRTRIEANTAFPDIASVSPGNAPTVPLQFVSGGRSQHSGAWFTVTGGQIGDAEVNFSAVGLGGSAGGTATTDSDDLTALDTRPQGQLAVHVRCKFRVTLSSTWRWNPGDISRTGYFTIPNVLLEPDTDGKFEVDARVSNEVIRSGPCGGADTVAPGEAHFSGRVSPDGLLNVTVTFSQVATTGTEGCKGKSSSDTAQAQPLTFIANVSTGQRRFFFQIPQTLEADGASHITDTIIYLTVLQ